MRCKRRDIIGSPIIFGEVLFDVFPENYERLGGAPFNVAWHLQGFGMHPLLISRIGKDNLAERILSAMDSWQMDTSGIQQDKERPTGRVAVETRGNEPVFHIKAKQAYDYIHLNQASAAVSTFHPFIMYSGTLALRSLVSYRTWKSLIRRDVPLFVDLNLRAPWIKPDRVENSLQRAAWAKLNEYELSVISGSNDREMPDIYANALDVARHYNLAYLVVTLGAAGAIIVTRSGRLLAGKGLEVADMADSVGAGDAFSAVLILGMWCQWPLLLTLQRALQFSAAICALKGAVSLSRSFYTEQMERWDKEEEQQQADYLDAPG